MFRRGLLILVLLSLLRPVSAAPRWHADLLYLETPDTSFGAAAQTFKTVVEARSGGRIAVSLHARGQWQGQVLEDIQMVNEVRAGRLQLALITTAPLSNLSPEMEVINLPFLFTGYPHVDRVLDGPIGEKMLADLSAYGLRGLTFMDGGFRIFASIRPIVHLADFRDLRVRTLQNRTYVEVVKAFGGVPVPAGINKIYEMVRRGFIDAADRSYPTYASLDLQQVLKFVTETNHAYAAKVLVINEAFYNSLPADLRAVVKQAAIEARAVQRRLFRADIAAVKRRVAAAGVRIIVLSSADRKAFETASRAVAEQVTRLVGKALVDQVRSAAGR